MSLFLRRVAATGTAIGVVVCSATAVNVTLRPETEYQTIVGFGGNDPRDQVNTLVNDLGMSAHRAWINCETAGGSQPSWSSMVEMKNAGVQCFIATPWSPPAHMKYVNSCSGMDETWNKLSNGLGPLNDYRHPNNDPEKGGLRNYYPDFAAHLVKYARDFRSNVGTDLYAISPQNELAFPEPYPSCIYYLNSSRQVNQFRDVVLEIGRAFATAGLGSVKMFGAEDMLSAWPVRPYVQLTMLDTGANGAAQYLDAVAVHGYSNGISPAPTSILASAWGGRSGVGTYARSKGLDVWMTETSGYVGWSGGQGPDGPCPGSQELGVAMYAALKYGFLSGWWWWRLAVTESYWTDEALLYNGTKQKQYYVSKVFYKYIRPGMQMIHVNDSADTELGVIAFRHKQNQLLTVVLVNSSTSAKQVSLLGQMPSGAFSGYVVDATRDWVTLPGGVTNGSLTVPASSFVTLHATGYNPSVNVFDHYREGQFTPAALRYGAVARIYTMSGALIRTIASPRFVSEKLAWDHRGDDGRAVATGAYYAVMSDAAGRVITERVSVGKR